MLPFEQVGIRERLVFSSAQRKWIINRYPKTEDVGYALLYKGMSNALQNVKLKLAIHGNSIHSHNAL